MLTLTARIKGSDYGYACRYAIQMKQSVCRANGVLLVVYYATLCSSYALLLLYQWFSVQLSSC